MSSPFFQMIMDPVGAILGAISPALGDAWTTLTKWTGAYYIGKWVSQNIVEPIIKWLFGLEDKDIYEVSVVACDMFKKGLYKEVQLDLVTKYMKHESWDARKYVTMFGETGDKQFGKFYRYGKWSYMDYLPELRISGVTIKTEYITNIINRTTNDDIKILDVLVTAPYDADWCKWLLQQRHGYVYDSDYLYMDGHYYKFGSVKYNSTTNKLDVTMNPIKTIRIRIYDTTTVTVTPISALDIKTYREDKCEKVIEDVQVIHKDIIAIKSIFEDVRIIEYETEKIVVVPHSSNPQLEVLHRAVNHAKEYYLDESMTIFLYENEVITYTPYEITAGSVKDSETTTILSNTVNGHYLTYTAVSRTDTSILISTNKTLEEKVQVSDISVKLASEPIEPTNTTTIDTEVVQQPFLKVTVATRIVNSDDLGNFINEDYTVDSVEYNAYTEGSKEWFYKTLVSHVEASGNETEHLVVARETTHSSVDTGIIYTKQVDIIKQESTPVPVGTGREYSNVSLVKDYDWTTGTTEPTYLSFETHGNKRMYSVYYDSMKTSTKHIWIYDPSLDVYPEISNPVEVIKNIEAYPIVMVRNSYYDIGDYAKNKKNGKDRPNSVEAKRYNCTKEILDQMGIDLQALTDAYSKNGDIDKVQDAFFLLGVSPSNNSAIVSKTLFEMFDFISDKFPYIEGTDTGHSATYKEYPFNASFIWTPKPVVISQGKIGMIGTYKHRVSGSTITLQKQITDIEIKTITLAECRCFTIVNWDIADGGVDFDMDSKDLVIPLVVPVVERLSLMDRTDLLGNSSYLIFYSFQHEHLEWYETEEFAAAAKIIGYAIAIIVAIVVTIFTWNPGAGATVFAILVAILTKILISLALMLVMKLIMDNVQDVRLKMALGILATAVAAWAGGGFSMGSIGQNAVMLVQCASTAMDIMAQDMNQKISKQMEKLRNEATDFQKKYEEKSKYLTDIYENMTSGLTASNMVGLIDMSPFADSRDESPDMLLVSPSQFHYLAIDAYRNYDMYYTGFYDSAVHRFYKNKLNIGITQDESEE